jgi:hypothetical protein
LGIQGKTSKLTIVAVQPRVMMNRQSGQLLQSLSGNITANWQLVDGMIYSDLKNPGDIANKRVELHQQIWNILVDIDKGEVLQLHSEMVEL